MAMNKLRISVVLGIIFVAGPAGISAQVNVGAGSYADQGFYNVPDAAPSVIADFSQKAISNKWWATLIAENYSASLFAHPLSFRAEGGGLQVGYPEGFNASHTAEG